MGSLKKGRIAGIVLCGLTILFCAGICVSQDLEITQNEGELWVTVSGQLMKVNMTAIKDVWQEYALRRDDNEMIILIGPKTDELKEMIGKRVSVSGVLRPRLRYGGALTRTVEVREVIKEGAASAAAEPAVTASQDLAPTTSK
jgi:hypothetical protein